jgi:hypothetical protein
MSGMRSGVATSAPAYYEHSGEFSPPQVVIGTMIGLVGSCVLAAVYAYAIYYIPFIYINALLTAGFGFALAVMSVHVLRGSKVRNGAVFGIVSLLFVAAAYYVHWAVWVGIALRASEVDVMAVDVATQPAALWGTMLDINSTGLWAIGSMQFAGGKLWAVWGIEGAMVFGIAVLAAWGMYVDLPFCERCETWCTKHENVARIRHGDAAAVAQAFERKDVETLQSFESVPLGQELGEWLECDLETCDSSCGATNILDMSMVAATKNAKGEVSKKKTDVVQNLLLTPEEVRVVRSLGGLA